MKTRSFLGIGTLTMAGLISAACSGGGEMDGSGGAGTDTGGTATDGGGGTSSGGTGTGGSGASSGGSSTGGVGTGGVSTGGVSTGGVGTGGSTGGASGGSDGFAGEGGMGGMGGFGGAPCVSELPTMQVQARSDTGADWDDNDFDSSDVQIELECPVALVSVTWPHEEDYDNGDPVDANFEYSQFNLEVINGNDFDYSGKQLNLSIRLLEEELGPNEEESGYDIYIGLTDYDDFTEVKTEHPAQTGELWDAGDSDEVVFVVPDDVAAFDPTNVYKIFIRIHNKMWNDGIDPMFDYESAVFEISEFSVTDAP